ANAIIRSLRARTVGRGPLIARGYPTIVTRFHFPDGTDIFPLAPSAYCPSAFCMAPASTFTAGPPLPD
ncbi:MAG: hypothetical protein QOD02_5439, partial [Mycobacterium sp.]|nr:hypothetical protein [Mycobacterium sp.]